MLVGLLLECDSTVERLLGGAAVLFHAFRSDYIANLLEQRRRLLPPADPVQLTHGSEHLELEMPGPDLTLYDPKLFLEDNEHEPPLCA